MLTEGGLHTTISLISVGLDYIPFSALICLAIAQWVQNVSANNVLSSIVFCII